MQHLLSAAVKAIDWEKLGGPIPGFDCLKLKDAAQARIQAQLAGMTREEELEFWRQKAAQLLGNHTKPVRKAGPARKQRRGA